SDDFAAGDDAAAAPTVSAHIIDVAGHVVGQADQRIIAVHLPIVTISAATGETVETGAAHMIGAIGIHRDTVDDGLAGGNGRAIRKIDIKIAAALARDKQDAAVWKIEHGHDERGIVVGCASWTIDLSETV